MLDAILRPRSIAVIGASRKPNTIGYQILENLVRHGYAGAVYPVNPTAAAVHSIRAYPSVEAVPDEVDMAVIVVPKQHVVEAAEACGRKGVKGLVVISAGFAEVGGSGVERQKALMEIVRRHGMRLVGPNCMGVLNTAPDRSMNATFAPTMPPAGPVSFMSQSGAMGVTILDYAKEYGIGISQFVSVGNKPDVSGNDLIQYWANDERTGVILMYLENFGNPRKFTQLAREITKKKPIIAVKSGRTGAGARAASSHTGALAGTDAATDALLRQCGVIRVETVEEMFDLAMAFSHQPVPRGNRVAIVTNAGGPGIIIADACEANGLVVTELTEGTKALLAAHQAGKIGAFGVSNFTAWQVEALAAHLPLRGVAQQLSADSGISSCAGSRSARSIRRPSSTVTSPGSPGPSSMRYAPARPSAISQCVVKIRNMRCSARMAAGFMSAPKMTSRST